MHDSMSVRFQGGAIGTISGSAAVPAGKLFQVDIRIFGSEGMLLLDVERERMVIHRDDEDDLVLDIPSGTGVYNCEGPTNQFIDLILGETDENYAPGDIAATSISLIEAAYQSATERLPVETYFP